jgi:hypothetical protein
MSDFEATPEWAKDAISETPKASSDLVPVSVNSAPAVPTMGETPRRYIPIPWSREYFPFTNLCGCGQEVPREWQPVDSPWRMCALSLGHGHCPHRLGFGRCPYEEQEEMSNHANEKSQ